MQLEYQTRRSKSVTKRRKKTARAIVVRPRVHIGESITIDAGKIDLLKQVDATRSISAAARAVGISYKHAWLLIDSLTRGLGRPVLATATGGRGGGGSVLTELGAQLVQRYGAIEARMSVSARADLKALRRLVG
jgi:molybdate transport system regulatory protein